MEFELTDCGHRESCLDWKNTKLRLDDAEEENEESHQEEANAAALDIDGRAAGVFWEVRAAFMRHR